MRSRYSAFVLGDTDYLLRTWHPSTRPASVELEAGEQWLGLDIRHHVITGEHSAEVEFVARFRVGGGRFGSTNAAVLFAKTVSGFTWMATFAECVSSGHDV
jgi:uncharacterized protein YchJ